jgi:hypothetical protein
MHRSKFCAMTRDSRTGFDNAMRLPSDPRGTNPRVMGAAGEAWARKPVVERLVSNRDVVLVIEPFW